jgi:hypothetical protein
MKIRNSVLALAILASACAGRDPRPVTAVRPTDTVLTCDLMLAEYNTNYQKAVRLAGNKSQTTGKNIALGVVGVLLFWPALFAMDLKGADRAEMEALRDRNNHLRQLMLVKHCRNIPEEIPIERNTKDDPKVELPEG